MVLGPISELSSAMSSVYALVVAAGQGSRFGGPLPKQYLPLGGSTILRHAVAALRGHGRIADVLVAIRPDDRALFESSLSGLTVMPAIIGGATRQDSVRLGLEALVAFRPHRVLIHDGARHARFQKVRELASWPTALAALRVCPGNPGNELNCGVCEKCLRTRLELLAAGVEETATLGASLAPGRIMLP